MTDTAPHLPSEGTPELVPDKRWLGMVLVTASSFAMVAIVALFVSQLLLPSPDDALARDAEQLQNFSTAAGSEQ